MANKRDSSKQKRARQNRAQREALKARTAAASQPAAERTSRPARAASTPSKAGATATTGQAATGGTPRKGFFSALREPRPLRPGDVPVDIETLEGNWFTKRVQVPGGRQVLTALALVIILSVMMAFQKYPPADAPADAELTESIVERFGAAAYLLVGLPLLLVAVAAQFTLHPRRRRIWVICTVLLSAAVVAALAVYIVHLIVVGYLIYAIQRASKIEGPVPGSRWARATATAKDDGDEPDADSA